MRRFSALAFAALAAAASAAVSPAAFQQAPFRTGTVLVEADAIVTDAQGRFVSELSAADFEILEDGQPQSIKRVYAVTGNTVSPRSAGPAAPEAETAPVAPAAAPPRVFVLLFDQEHLQVGAFKRLQDAALAFLRDEFKPGDVGGIVIGTTMAGNQLTSDRDQLVAALRAAKPGSSSTARRLDLLEWPRFSQAEAIRIALSNDRDVLAQVVRRACQDDPGACKNIDPEPIMREKARMIVGDLRPAARRTVMTLQALASGLGRLPGRKTVILLTEGFFVEEAWADLRRFVGAAAKSNVRIYSLDARGLDTRQANDLHQMSVMDPGGGMPLEAYNSSEDGPNALAADTGGYPIRHTNNFAEALSEIARDTSNYYVIGYTPTNTAMDGAFRKITVRVKRPGLRVRARRGYLATPPAMTSTAAPAPDASSNEVAVAAPVARADLPGESIPLSAVSSSAVPSANAEASPKAEASSAGTSSAAVVLRPDSSERVRALASHDAPESEESFASRGWERYQKGDLEGAAEWLGRAAADPGVHPWVHYALGYAALGLGRAHEAAAEWERVRQVAPEFLPVYLDLADAYVHLQNYGRALETLRAAAARWPADIDVLNAMGTIQVRRGALDDAIATFGKATEAKPQDALAYFNLGRTYELRYYRMRRWVRMSPSEGHWMGNPVDVKRAIASYERYVKLGGPFVTQARESMQNLQWLK
jgi:VWFA-related protein